MHLGRERPDGSQRRFIPGVYQARTKDRIGEGPEPPGGFPGAGAQLAPEPLDEEDLEEVDDDRGHAQARVKELGVQGLEECLPPPARPDPLRVQGRDGRKRNRQASSTPQLDACGEQQRRAGIIRGRTSSSGIPAFQSNCEVAGRSGPGAWIVHSRVPESSRAHPVPSGRGCRDSAEHARPRPRRSRCREGGPSGTKRAHSPRKTCVRGAWISRRRSVRKLLSRSSMSRGQRLQEADAVRGRRNAQEASGAMDHRAPTGGRREGEAAEESRVREPRLRRAGKAAELGEADAAGSTPGRHVVARAARRPKWATGSGPRRNATCSSGQRFGRRRLAERLRVSENRHARVGAAGRSPHRDTPPPPGPRPAMCSPARALPALTRLPICQPPTLPTPRCTSPNRRRCPRRHTRLIPNSPSRAGTLPRRPAPFRSHAPAPPRAPLPAG